MILALVWGLASLGVVFSGLAFAILTVGLLEGWHVMPDQAAQVVALVIVVTGAWTAGVLCVRAPGRWAALAVALVPAAVLGLGFALMEKSESHGGTGLAPQLVAEAVAASAALVGGAAFVARRSGSPGFEDAA